MTLCSNNVLKKLAFVIGVLAFSLSTYIIGKTPPAQGYELTIYKAYPWSLWLSLIVSFASGVIIILIDAVRNRNLITKDYYLGIILIVVTNVTVLGLPYFRGYYIYPQGDALTHLGHIKDVMLSGYINSENFYPIVHILGAYLQNILDINENTVVILLYTLGSLVYFSNVCLLGSAIAKDKRILLLLCVFVSPLILSYLHTLIHPSLFSLYMVPLFLYFFIRISTKQSNIIGNTLLILLIALNIVFAHPVTSLFLIMLLLSSYLNNLLYNKIKGSNLAIYNPINIILIIFVVFFIWHINFPVIQGNIKSVYNFFMFHLQSSLYEHSINLVDESGLTIYQSIKIFLNRFGAILIYVLMSLISLILLLFAFKKGKKVQYNYLICITFFIVAILFSVFSLCGFTGEYSILRISRFFLFLIPIVISLGLSVLRKNVVPIYFLFGFLIITVQVISLSNVYSSQRTFDSNWQLTKMQTVGSEWFISHNNKDIGCAEIVNSINPGRCSIFRMEDLILGIDNANRTRTQIIDPIPAHFGYNSSNSICRALRLIDVDKSAYLLISEMGKASEELIPENAKLKAHIYSRDDYLKMQKDPYVLHLYSNGEYDVALAFAN